LEANSLRNTLFTGSGSAVGHPDGPKLWPIGVGQRQGVDGRRERPEVEGIACWQGRILAVGSTAEMRTLIGRAHRSSMPTALGLCRVFTIAMPMFWFRIAAQ